jgi:deazaflavin-dependent oxidoreductase (nitroreductase family)
VILSRTLRWLFRTPAHLYRWKCGWLLGHRFMLLGHIGRHTGLHRQTVLEVMEFRTEGPEAIVMCAFGVSAHWFRNIEATPELDVRIGRRHFSAVYRTLAAEEAASVVKGYEQRNKFIAPIVRAVLSRLLGWHYDGSERACRRLVTQLPLIGFSPREDHADPH